MRERFAQEIAELKQRVQEMAAKAENAMNRAMHAVNRQEKTDAEAVVAGDSEIDSMEIGIEEECLKLMALYQPVAGDLRMIVTILKVNSELERTADLAVNIAQRAIDMANYPEDRIEKFDFCDMVELVHGMLKNALDSLVYHDSLKAVNVISDDDKVDTIHRSNYGKVKDMILKHPAEAGYYLDCLTVSRALERAADIATNICEDVIYLEQGRIVRHMYPHS